VSASFASDIYRNMQPWPNTWYSNSKHNEKISKFLFNF